MLIVIVEQMKCKQKINKNDSHTHTQKHRQFIRNRIKTQKNSDESRRERGSETHREKQQQQKTTES